MIERDIRQRPAAWITRRDRELVALDGRNRGQCRDGDIGNAHPNTVSSTVPSVVLSTRPTTVRSLADRSNQVTPAGAKVRDTTSLILRVSPFDLSVKE